MKYLLLMFAPFFFFSTEVFADNASPVRIGVVYGFTGAAQAWSDYGRMGLELARDELNAQGGVHGRAIELEFEDSKTIPAESVTSYRKLVNIDHVAAVIGNVWSFLTNPLIPLATKDRIVLISPTVMNASVERTSDYFFTMGYHIESITSSIDMFFQVNPEVKKIAILCWEDAWGLAHEKLWKRIAQEHGAEIVDEICQTDFTTDYRTDVTRIAAKHPDAIVTAMYADRVLQRMKEQGVRAKVLTTSDMVEALYVRKADPKLLEGCYFTNWQPNDEFVDSFKKKFGKEPILEAQNHYEALRSLVKALNAQGNLLQGLRELHYDGVSGAIDFRGTPFPNKGEGKLFVIQDEGRIHPVN